MNEKERMVLLKTRAQRYRDSLLNDFESASEAQEQMYRMLSPLVVIDLVNAWLEVETEKTE